MNVHRKPNARIPANRTVSATEANQKFASLLQEVRRGATVTITTRGKPVAVLEPYDTEAERSEAEERERRFQAMIEEWRRRPVMNLGKFNREDAYD